MKSISIGSGGVQVKMDAVEIAFPSLMDVGKKQALGAQ